MIFPKIETPNLILRDIKAKDIFPYTELFYDKETMILFGGINLTDELGLKDVVEFIKNDFDKGFSIFWVITLANEKEFIGFIRLSSYSGHHFDQSFAFMGELRNHPDFLKLINKNGWEVDYALLKNYRGIGIMSEAMYSIMDFCQTNKISPIYAKVNNLENLPTIAILKKNGFIEFLPQINEKGHLGCIYKRTN